MNPVQLAFKGITKLAGPKIVAAPRQIAKLAGVTKGSKCDAFVKSVEETVAKYTGGKWTKTVDGIGVQRINFQNGKKVVVTPLKNGGNWIRTDYPNGISRDVISSPLDFTIGYGNPKGGLYYSTECEKASAWTALENFVTK